MFQVFWSMLLRLGVGLLAIIVYMNLLGRMQLAPQSAVDQIGNYILGGILGGIIYNLDLEFYKFFMAIIIWTSLMLFITYLTNRNLESKRMIKGNPILLMENNEFLTEEFKKNKIHLDDILSRLHQTGVYTMENVYTIWLEPNGQLTVIQKDEKHVAWVLIEDGEVNKLDLFRLKKDEDWLLGKLKDLGIDSIEDVFYGEYLNGDLIVYGYNKKESPIAKITS